MPNHASSFVHQPASDFVVPGTCFARPVRAAHRGRLTQPRTDRDPTLRNLYLRAALADVPRLLGAVDRNPYRPTCGCLDRQYWHYRTASFPSQMYQEGALPLALIHAAELPGNRWHGDLRVRELAIAALRFAARSSHADGSCDDYYPYERALGAAVFSLEAAAAAYQVLELDDPELLDWFRLRANWLIRHDETGHLANHQAIAALGLFRVGRIAKEAKYTEAAEARVRKVLGWQSDEGWFEEYGGADPGYQTVTIDALAKIRRLTGDRQLDEPLSRAVAFARSFLHPDGSYAGEYGSRGTYHFYPHGMELLAAENADAADLADGFLRGLGAGNQAALSDDRMFTHGLANLLGAYIDWSPSRPDAPSQPADASLRYFPGAGLLVRRKDAQHTVISAARGGVFKHFDGSGAVVTDSGLIVEMEDGRVAVSQMHESKATAESAARNVTGNIPEGDRIEKATLSVGGPLCWAWFETATPIKQAVFHTAMTTIGRRCRSLVRRMLQRRLITGRRPCPVKLSRLFEFLPEPDSISGFRLRVTDTIELTDPRIRVRRMSFGTDHQTAYVAAGNVYQQSVLAPWTDLSQHVDELNSWRRVTVVREM